MFRTFGTPEPLSSIGQESIDMVEARLRVEIAVLDDNPFAPRDALVHHQPAHVPKPSVVRRCVPFFTAY